MAEEVNNIDTEMITGVDASGEPEIHLNTSKVRKAFMIGAVPGMFVLGFTFLSSLGSSSSSVHSVLSGEEVSSPILMGSMIHFIVAGMSFMGMTWVTYAIGPIFKGVAWHGPVAWIGLMAAWFLGMYLFYVQAMGSITG